VAPPPRVRSIAAVYGPAIVVILPLVAANWLTPPGFPPLLRQILLCAWGVGAIVVCERLLFSATARDALRALGFVRARGPAILVALLVSVPMWIFLPVYAWRRGVPIALRPDWPALLAGVILVNGLAEEVIHRAFVFGHFREDRPFAAAAALSALLFAAQHFSLILIVGWTSGLASVLLAALLTFPMAYVFERGGNAIAGPAILHTNTNAPMITLMLPADVIAAALVPYMGAILLSLYGVFGFRTFLASRSSR
jgi:membrane protease YdiL (CAAX protease family)